MRSLIKFISFSCFTLSVLSIFPIFSFERHDPPGLAIPDDIEGTIKRLFIWFGSANALTAAATSLILFRKEREATWVTIPSLFILITLSLIYFFYI